MAYSIPALSLLPFTSLSSSLVVYDVLTGRVVSRLAGHEACVRDVSWHPYQDNIISSSVSVTSSLSAGKHISLLFFYQKNCKYHTVLLLKPVKTLFKLLGFFLIIICDMMKRPVIYEVSNKGRFKKYRLFKENKHKVSY